MKSLQISGWLRRPARRAWAPVVAAVVLTTGFAVRAQDITGVFTDAGSAPAWSVSSAPRVKSATDGSGWLRLVSAEDRAALGRVQARTVLPPDAPIRLEFDTVTWGGGRFMNDGITIYFFDPKAAAAGAGALGGGAMGYCNMNGAYLGIAIDDYGNFARTRCGYNHGWMPPSGVTDGRRAHSVTVRGPKTTSINTSQLVVKSAPLGSTVARICYRCSTREEGIAQGLRHVVLEMMPRTPPDLGYTLNMSINGTEILKSETFAFAAPAGLMMGLVSSTGSSSAIQEVRNLKLTLAAPICFSGTRPDGTCRPTTNNIADWLVYGQIGTLFSYETAPPELVDGDLVQKGWNGAAAWTAKYPKLPPGQCLNMGPQSRFGSPVPANQIVIVSRQDDAANAVDPTLNTTFTKHGAVDFEVLYYTATSQGLPLHAATVTGNDKVMRVVDLPRTEQINVVSVKICKTADNNSSPLTEILVREKK
jgi:hypothetical protein